MLTNDFFSRDAMTVAQELLGKILRARYEDTWLSMMIIETEAYYQHEKGSHSSLGFTEKRKALFMEPGTIYMYYARGGDSLNVSCVGEGNAVLIKSGIPYLQDAAQKMLEIMHHLNPVRSTGRKRDDMRLGSGQTLLCRSLNLKVPQWDKQTFTFERLRIDDAGYRPEQIIQTKRLGIPIGRDEHLPYRFVDLAYAKYCTRYP